MRRKLEDLIMELWATAFLEGKHIGATGEPSEDLVGNTLKAWSELKAYFDREQDDSDAA